MVKNFKAREEKQQKRSRMIMGVFIVVIMVGSTLGFFIGGNSGSGNGIEYVNDNGEKYSFQPSGGKYYTEIDDKALFFYSLPFDTERLNISDEADSLIKNSQVFLITFDPESKDIQYIEQARFDLEADLSAFNKFLVPGVTQNSSEYNLDIITCENATQFMPVIHLKASNRTTGFVEDNCFIFEGQRLDFLKFRDFVVYTLYGVV